MFDFINIRMILQFAGYLIGFSREFVRFHCDDQSPANVTESNTPPNTSRLKRSGIECMLNWVPQAGAGSIRTVFT